jgi:hypothetical protein
VHREEDSLLSDEQATTGFRRTSAAVRELERTVLGGGGLALRYGYF